MDWSASRHDVLYVAAWPNSDVFEPATPSDNFNGMTVASSYFDDQAAETVYDRFSVNHNAFPDNTLDASGPRTSIDLLAPGEFIRVLGYNNGPDDEDIVNGSSYAAPHVTGTAALLQQYATQRIDDSDPLFHNRRSRRHEVMKAVMLNSADKLQGVHGSARDIIDSSSNTWLSSEAYTTQFQSLDDQMGAGHLNAERAVAQFSAGEQSPGTVPLIGWDLGETGGSGDQFEYVLDGELQAGQYIAVTLAWDRRVELTNPDDSYSTGDQFFDYSNVEDVLNDLNIYLVPADNPGTTGAIWSSQTFEDNVEHIFREIPTTGEYKIVVDHRFTSGLDDQQEYGLAWWYGNPAVVVAGDYDGSGTIDAGDYAVWRSNYGSSVTPGTGADGNGDGVVDAADYTVWRDSLATASARTVPEPAGWLLCGVLAAAPPRRFRRA